MTLTFNLQAMIMIHESRPTHMQKIKVKGLSVQKIEWIQMGGWTDESIALPVLLMRSVNIELVSIVFPSVLEHCGLGC